MDKISPVLRRVRNGHAHWCPGCAEMHVIPDSWSFDGNAAVPTFTPSVKITGKMRVKENGIWTGGWVRDAAGNLVDECCHYILTAGRIHYCADSTHALAGQTVELPALPADLRDEDAV